LKYKKNMAVLGDKDDVLPFMAIGAEIFLSTNIDEIKNAIIEFAEKGYAIILVSDDYLKEMPEIIEQFALSPMPSITSIPGRNGKSSFANERLNNVIKKAIGIDITSKKGDS
jgi:V/A-type H+/Na+-transporting ATPase subunit F